MSAATEAARKPVLLRGGNDLVRWIEAGGRVERVSPFLMLRLRWAAYWFERFAELTQRRTSTLNLPGKMVFIVGLWRSGSTVLHQELVSATGWATPRTWQCFSPSDFLLRPPPRDSSIIRPMDEGLIGTFTPQEDEFAALLLGEASVYRAFIDPRRFDELSGLLGEWKSSPPSDAPPLSARWEVFLKSISLMQPGPMLLKSPNHTFRLPWLARRFPNARFIWLTRSSTDLRNSNRRMWSAMTRRYGLWHAPPNSLERFISCAMANHDQLLDWARSEMVDRITEVTFDEVMNDRRRLVVRLSEIFK